VPVVENAPVHYVLIKSPGVKTSAKTSGRSPPLVSSTINGFLGYFYRGVHKNLARGSFPCSVFLRVL
jgi:hypothetical protein